MNYNEALAKLKACGQEHVLNHYDALSDQEKEALLAQVAQTDFSVTENIGREIKRGKISAIGTMELSEIKEREDEFRAKGLQAIREGKLAAVLLAGGMGTRLGSDNPKCMYDIGITKHVYIMQRLIENVMEVTDDAGRMRRVSKGFAEHKNKRATPACFFILTVPPARTPLSPSVCFLPIYYIWEV